MLLGMTIGKAQTLKELIDRAKDSLHYRLLPWDKLEEDSHPEVPEYTRLMWDTTKCRKIPVGMYNDWDPLFLKSGLVVSASVSGLELITFEGKVMHSLPTSRAYKPVFVDSVGNIFCGGRKHMYPQYSKSVPFPFVHVHDTLERIRNGCLSGPNDTIRAHYYCYRDRAGVFLKHHGFPLEWAAEADHFPCAKFFGPMNGYLVSEDDFRMAVSNFNMAHQPIPQFDDPVRFHLEKNPLFRDRHRMYIRYYELPNGLRFKCLDYLDHPVMFLDQGNHYVYSRSIGLFRIL